MTVDEAVIIITSMRSMARRIGHTFEPSDIKLLSVGFTRSEVGRILAEVGRYESPGLFGDEES